MVHLSKRSSMRRFSLCFSGFLFLLISGLPSAVAQGWWLFKLAPAANQLKHWSDTNSSTRNRTVPEVSESFLPDLTLPQTNEPPNSGNGPLIEADISSHETFRQVPSNVTTKPSSKDSPNFFSPLSAGKNGSTESDRKLGCMRMANFDTTSASYELCLRRTPSGVTNIPESRRSKSPTDSPIAGSSKSTENDRELICMRAANFDTSSVSYKSCLLRVE